MTSTWISGDKDVTFSHARFLRWDVVVCWQKVICSSSVSHRLHVVQARDTSSHGQEMPSLRGRAAQPYWGNNKGWWYCNYSFVIIKLKHWSNDGGTKWKAIWSLKWLHSSSIERQNVNFIVALEKRSGDYQRHGCHPLQKDMHGNPYNSWWDIPTWLELPLQSLNPCVTKNETSKGGEKKQKLYSTPSFAATGILKTGIWQSFQTSDHDLSRVKLSLFVQPLIKEAVSTGYTTGT